MYIKKNWVRLSDGVVSGLNALREEMFQSYSLPNVIYIVNAGEASILMDHDILLFIAELEIAGFDIRFVSSACTSFHAAILHFIECHSRDALILNLDLNVEQQQTCLNAVGVGVLSGQDGLQVRTGVAFTHICKDIQSGCKYQITNCDLLSQPLGLNGTHQLLNTIKALIKSNNDREKVVSFDIQSIWAKSIMKGLGNPPRGNWLDSIECDQKHFLSLKPLIEIEHYHEYLNHHKLWIMTLGGGGRIGCLQLIALKHEQPSSPMLLSKVVNKVSVSLEDTYWKLLAFYRDKPNLSQNDAMQYMKACMCYPLKSYRGKHNQIFHWEVESGGWQKLVDAHQKKTISRTMDTIS